MSDLLKSNFNLSIFSGFYNKKSTFQLLITLVIYITFLFSVNFESKAIIPDPMIDCNGNVFCNEPGAILSDWTSSPMNLKFWFGNSIIFPQFRVKSCCTPLGCQYIVELTGIDIMGTNTQYEAINEEVIKFIMSYLPTMQNIERYKSFNIHYMQPRCMKNNTIVDHGAVLTSLDICSVGCCRDVFNVYNMGSYVRLQEQKHFPNDPFPNCPIDPIEPNSCNYTCNSINLDPYFNMDIIYSPYNDENCLSDCYWKVDGNEEITNDNFIGPTDGNDFVIKTKNSENSTIMERIRVDNNRKIDFKLNSWFSMPQITFDAALTGSEAIDPTIKLYRPTGGLAVEGLFPAHPWWISVSNLNGEDGWGAFNIWSAIDGTTPLVGQETGMVKRFSILKNGNVGIGIENPAQKLVVDGTICAKEVNITDPVCAWPDYVFTNDYKLLSFDELEKTISEKGSLPGVPTADEVNSNGIPIGRMQAILLKKIEELTLYVIKLNKENDKLNKKNVELDKKLKSLKIK